MQFKFELKKASDASYTQVNDPINWPSFTEKITIDEDLRLLSINYENNLTWDSDGYALIHDDYLDSGYCSEFDIRISSRCDTNASYIPFINAKIFISETKFDLQLFTAETQIRDTSWQSKLENNKKQSIVVTTTRSKNAVDISASTPADLLLTLFNPNTGVLINSHQAYDVKDVFTLLVAFMTDDEVSFESTWYDNLPSTEKLSLTQGKVIRDPLFAVEAISVSFEQLFTQMKNLYNLFVVTETTGVTPVIRIEDEDYVRGTDSGITIHDIIDLEITIDTEKLYGNVKLGSSQFIKDEDSSYPGVSLPYLITNTFVIEDYQMEGVCNINKTLDLSTEFITDHNIIEDIIRNANDDFDDDIFIIQYTPGAPDTATIGYYIGNQSGTPQFYNEELRNSVVLNRWSLPTDVIRYVGDDDDGVTVRRNTQPNIVAAHQPTLVCVPATIVQPLEYQDEVCAQCADPNGNFNNTAVGVDAYSYTAPVAGTYSFTIRITMANITYSAAPASEAIKVDMERFNAAGVSQQVYSDKTIQLFDNRGVDSADPIFIREEVSEVPFDLKGEVVDGGVDDVQIQLNLFGIYMEATDFIQVDFCYLARDDGGLDSTTFDLGSNQVGTRADLFICTAPNTGGGIVEENNPDDYIVNKYSFDRNVSDDDWSSIRANPEEFINIMPELNVKEGYIDSMQRNLSTGETQTVLKTKL